MNKPYELLKEDYRGDNFGENTKDLAHDQQFLLQDFVTLTNQGLIERADNTAMLDISDVAPGNMKLTFIGKSYYDFLSLREIPATEFHFLDFLKE